VVAGHRASVMPRREVCAIRINRKGMTGKKKERNGAKQNMHGHTGGIRVKSSAQTKKKLKY